MTTKQVGVSKMAEYIDREKIFPNGVFYVCESHPEKSLDELINRICDAPTEDVQEVKHGELKDITDFGNGVCIGYCSHCGTEHRGKNPSLLIYSYKYCRWCGAKMDGDGE